MRCRSGLVVSALDCCWIGPRLKRRKESYKESTIKERKNGLPETVKRKGTTEIKKERKRKRKKKERKKERKIDECQTAYIGGRSICHGKVKAKRV